MSLSSSPCSPKPVELNEILSGLVNFPSASHHPMDFSHVQEPESNVEPTTDTLFQVEEPQHQSWYYDFSAQYLESPLAGVRPVDSESQCIQSAQQEYPYSQIYAVKNAPYLITPTMSFPTPDISYRQHSPLSLVPATPSTSHSQGTSPYWRNGSISSAPTTPLSFPLQPGFPEPAPLPRPAQLTYQKQITWWKNAREMPAAGGLPVFIPQRIYKPHTTSDIKRYVEEVDLVAPIFFWMDGPEECGISLNDSLHGRTKRLRDRDKEVFEGRGPSVSIRLEWPGYRQWSRQIPTKDFKSPPRPISMAKLCKNVAKCVQRFISERQHCELEDGADATWKVGETGIRFEDLVLVSLHHVSMGSWQPQLRLRKRMK